MRITKEIYQVGGSELTSADDAAIYLVAVNGHAALIDAGCGRAQDRLLKNIRSTGTDPNSIAYIFLTHCHFDHTGGVKKLKDLIACKVVAHELDAVYLEQGDDQVTAAGWYGARLEPFTVDIKLREQHETIKLGDKSIDAIHIPGHSPGSVAYLFESEGMRVLFAQDVHGPLSSSLLSNRGDYIRSLELLLSLDADILCEGHYGIYQGKLEIKKFIQQFL